MRPQGEALNQSDGCVARHLELRWATMKGNTRNLFEDSKRPSFPLTHISFREEQRNRNGYQWSTYIFTLKRRP